MSTALIAAGALVVGIAIGIVLCEATIRHLRRRVKELRTELRDSGMERPRNLIQSITRFLFVTTQICAIGWVSWTYIIATYSTVALEQPFPAEELSSEAVRTILGVGVLKLIENIFEHNDSKLFGQSRNRDVLPAEEDPPDDTGGEEGGVG